MRSSRPSRHALYEAAVQCSETELSMAERLYRTRHGRLPRQLREDFCGTALVACDWALRRAENEAWGIDLDAKTLDWGRRHHAGMIGDAAARVHLLQDDVLSAATPPADVCLALNFSYGVFKTRPELRNYFRAARKALRPGGLFLIDAFGGHESGTVKSERRRVAASTLRDGTRVPGFTYVWEHAAFNPVTHDIVCHIHFHLRGGPRIQRAFTYRWRLWTLPELQEIMREAGFAEAQVYIHGFKDNGESDDIWRRRTRYENCDAWIAYLAGWRA